MPYLEAGIAVVSGVTALAGGIMGSSAAKKAAKAQKRLIRLEANENLLAMRKQYQQLTGIQQTGYAAAGVSVDVGTPAALQAEAEKNLVEASYYEALKTEQLLKGASAAGKAASSGYITQGIMGATSAASGYLAATK